MKQLPYIDEYATPVAADRDSTWEALRRFALRGDTEPPRAMTGFAVEELVVPERLTLTGRHWFSTYALVFLLDEDGPDRTILRAQSWADFPGLHGKLYRALVIGTRGHRAVVKRMLAGIAADAQQAGVRR